MKLKFEDIELLNENVLNSLKQIGFENPTPIQAKTIRHAIEGRDVIGQAETGTGKTGAFVIPIVNMIDEESASFEHLIIAPTRELATQIYQEIKRIGHYSYVRVCLILGGVAYQKQRKALNEKPHIVVATPGRLNEYLVNGQIHFDHLKTFTLDEADELLNIGFQREIESIMSYLPKDRQNFFFSATFNDRTKRLSEMIIKENAENASVSTGLKTTKTIRQQYIVVKEKHKWNTLVQRLEFYKPQSVIIFGRTKKRIDELNEALNDRGFSSSAIQGDLKQRERHFVLERFRNQQKKILVATDVMARGIDVSHVEWIINFDLPQEIESYTHRIGRTGRAGKIGYSISLVRPNEIEHIREIAFRTKSKIDEMTLPSKEEINQVWKNDTEAKLNKILEDDLEEKDNEQFHFESELMEKFTHEQLAAFVAHFLLQNRYKKVQLTPEPAVVLKGQAKIRLIKNQINKHHQNKHQNQGANNNNQTKKNQNHNFANNFNHKQFSEKSKSNKHKPFIQKKKYKSIQRQTQHGKNWR